MNRSRVNDQKQNLKPLQKLYRHFHLSGCNEATYARAPSHQRTACKSPSYRYATAFKPQQEVNCPKVETYFTQEVFGGWANQVPTYLNWQLQLSLHKVLQLLLDLVWSHNATFSTLFEDKFPYVAMFAFVSVNGCFSLSHNNAVFKYQVYQWSTMAEIFNECE